MAPRAPPPPVAIFASNPLRGLDWLLDLWAARIRPALPLAELHLYTGAATYGGDARLAARAAPVLARAAGMAGQGVRVFDPLPRPVLAARLSEARLMLYRGDPGETFCLALAEAQASGLPAVVTPLGAVAERVADGVTGVVARSDAARCRRRRSAAVATTPPGPQCTAPPWPAAPARSWDEVAAPVRGFGMTLRIAHVMAGAAMGGAEAFYERLALAQHAAGEEVLAVIRQEAGRAARLRAGGLRPVELPMGGYFDLVTRPRLGRVLAGFGPRVVVAWATGPGAMPGR